MEIALSGLICMSWLWLAMRSRRLQRHFSRLSSHDYPSTAAPGEQVLISILIPARNEERTMLASLPLLLEQTTRDPRYEVILVDDQSTDATGAIADALAARYPRVHVIHLVEPPPPGWWGKSHALQRAYACASGAYLIFRDVDTVNQPGSLNAVANYVQQHRPDHLVVYPRLMFESHVEAGFLALFAVLFLLKFDPIGAAKPGVDSFTGIGAFSLARRDIYESFGMHRRLALEAADDIKLGRLVKMAGGTTHVLAGGDMMSIRWRRGFVDTIRGAARILFAGIDYSWRWVVIGVIGIVLGLLGPYWLIVVSRGWPAMLLSATSMILIGWIYEIHASFLYTSRRAWLLHPVMSLAFLYAYLGSAISVTLRGGIHWRDRFVSLAQLRSASVRTDRRVARPASPAVSAPWAREALTRGSDRG